MKTTPTVLSIAGFDPYGGAGIQADIKTVHALGCYAYSVTTAVTAQNSQGVAASYPLPAAQVEMQLRTLLDDVRVDAVKIGMLGNAEVVETVARVLKAYEVSNIVLDTVLVSSSGALLLDEAGREMMVTKLFPMARLVTPNLDETNVLLNETFEGTAREVLMMAEGFFSLGARNVLLKGGHSAEEEAVDYLVEASNISRFSHPRIDTTRTHGTGCVLSSAIAAKLAQGMALAPAVKQAKKFLSQRLEASWPKLAYVSRKRKRKEPFI